MKYIVTGGAGFIGSNLVHRLLDDGHSVIVIDDLSTGKIDRIACYLDNPNFCFFEKDVSSIADHVQFENIDGIFHLAARARIQPSIEDPVKYDFANIHGTVSMLDLARKLGCKIVFSSSSSVYGDQESMPLKESMQKNPLNPYAFQKSVGEDYCKLFESLYGLKYAALRYFNVYGEGQLVDGPYCTAIGIFLSQHKNGEPFTIVGDGLQRRDFTYVKDVVEANILAMEKGSGIYNIGNGKNRSVKEIALAIDQGAICKQIFRKAEVKETLADNTKAREELGWIPKGDAIEWIKTQI